MMISIFNVLVYLKLIRSVSTGLILLGTRPHRAKARNTRDVKNGGMRFECVNYCVLRRNNTASENNMEHPPAPDNGCE